MAEQAQIAVVASEAGSVDNRRDKALKWCRGYLMQNYGELISLNSFREAIRNEDFLHHLFELFDEDGDGLVDQDDFVKNFRVRLTEDRGKQFAALMETATFAVALEQFINEGVFAKILATKGVVDKLYQLIDRSGNGFILLNECMDFIASLTVTQLQTSLTKENLQYLEKLFREHGGDSNEITLENFRKIIQSKNVFFTERAFQLFDRDGSGSVSLPEFLDSISKWSQSIDAKIKFLFDIYDLDGDGEILQHELRYVISACMEENGVTFTDEQVDNLAQALFHDADVNHNGALSFVALKSQLQKHEGLLENLCTSIDRWLVPPRPPKLSFWKKMGALRPHQMSLGYMKNNYVLITFIVAFLAVNVGLFVSRCLEYTKRYNGFVGVARGCGQCLNFNCMFVLVLMLRKSITWLRSRGFSSVFPLDDHIYLHELTGFFIFAHSVVHTVAHVGNLVWIAEAADRNSTVNETSVSTVQFVAERLFTTKAGVGWIADSAFITGDILIVVLIIKVLCSQPCVRKRGNFEVFYWTHRLYIVFFILLILHAPRFWQWFIFPGVLFCIEVIFKLSQLRRGHGQTMVTEGILLPSKVTHLVVKRPPNFFFRPGDYVFLRIPEIAKYEWHPFTISSAPEQEDFLWLHIRGVGQWTNQLYSFIDKQQGKLLESNTAVCVDITSTPSPSQTAIDGVTLTSLKPKPKLLSSTASPQIRFVCDASNPDQPQNNRESSAQPERSMGQNFKYLRKKPNVVRMNTMASIVIQEGAEEQHTGTGKSQQSSSYPELQDARLEGGESNDDLGEDLKAVNYDLTSCYNNVDCFDEMGALSPIQVYIDGPYGAPSSHIFRAEHAVLIATGIGVTPFASILQSIMMRYKKARQKCPKCEHSWTAELPSSILNLKKVDFFWINRDQNSFEWFVTLLSQLEIEQAELGGVMDRFLEMHMYITSALQKTDMKAVGLHLAMDLLHEKEKRDLITGLKTRTQAGRPNWNKVFHRIAQENKGKVTVFFCGPPELARTLKHKCSDFGFAFKKEVF